jgi:tRNA(Met) C34 N-acetyltransferase TmcA
VVCPDNGSNRACRDSRIPALIRNGQQEKKRSFFVVVGDRSKDVIVHLHYIMSRLDGKEQPKGILWAYKTKLIGFTRYGQIPPTSRALCADEKAWVVTKRSGRPR